MQAYMYTLKAELTGAGLPIPPQPIRRSQPEPKAPTCTQDLTAAERAIVLNISELIGNDVVTHARAECELAELTRSYVARQTYIEELSEALLDAGIGIPNSPDMSLRTDWWAI